MIENVLSEMVGLWDFLAGVVEATIGILLVSGFLTRVVILGIWVPLNIGIPFLPPHELLGHLPICGIMYLLLVHGSGIGPEKRTQLAVTPGGSEQVLSPNSIFGVYSK